MITSRKTIGVIMIQNLFSHYFQGSMADWAHDGRIFLQEVQEERMPPQLPKKTNKTKLRDCKSQHGEGRWFEEEPECDMCILLPYLALRISLCTYVYIYMHIIIYTAKRPFQCPHLRFQSCLSILSQVTLKRYIYI